MMIFDTHAHYTAHQFDADRAALLDNLPAQGVCGVVDCATDLATARQSIALAEQYPYFYTAVGIHPQSLIEDDTSTHLQFGGDWRAELAAMEPLLAHSRVVAVGECGLDYHWPIPKEPQLALFEAHLELARRVQLPILVHDREAHADVYARLRTYKPQGIVHCYSGSADDAAWLTAQGLYLGIGGMVTFRNAKKLREVVQSVPLERLVLETDCPYIAPVPHRGERCDSSMILFTAREIAALRGTDADEVLRVTRENAMRLLTKCFHVV